MSKLTAVLLDAAIGIDSWNSFGAPQLGFAPEVFFLSLSGDQTERTRVLLRDQAGQRGVSLGFNIRQMPCFTLWKNTVPVADGYATRLEPGTNYPNPHSFENEHGRVVWLAGGRRSGFNLELTAHVLSAEVSAAEREITVLRNPIVTEMLRRPQTNWCRCAR